MKFLSLEPFVPSGSDLENAKLFFEELGFSKKWDMGDYAGFENAACNFILQKYDNPAFAENLMISVKVSSVEEFRQSVLEKNLPERFGIRISSIIRQPYGLEINVIDKAGVCWHFVE